MWWIEAVRWVVQAAAVGGGCFVVWRRMRPEYPEEEILSVCLGVLTAAAAGSWLGRWIGVWGGLVPAAGVLAGYTWRKEWDGWEWADVVGGVSLATGAAVLAAGGNWLLAWAVLGGVVPAGLVAGNYRKFKWYKSGKPGLVGVTSLVWWGLAEIGVETVAPRTIYWVGLTVAQWLSVGVIVLAVIVGYLRSGQMVATQIWRKVKISKSRE